MLYRELTTVVPFYLSAINQNRHKENVAKTCDAQRLISPNNYFLPFMINVHCGKPPKKWIIRDIEGNEFVDVTPSISELYGVKFLDGKVYAYFKGGKLKYNDFVAGRSPIPEDWISTEKRPPELRTLVLCGHYYHEITFGDVTYSSELIEYLNINKYDFENNFMKIEFSSESHISDIRYIDDFKQVVYLDTFSHTSEVVFEEDGETDGDDKFIPTFQKMNIYHKNNIVTRDFLKNALHTLKFHDEITVSYKDERFGNVISVEVASEDVENGALHDVTFDFLTNVLTKSGCKNDNIEIKDFFNFVDIEEELNFTLQSGINRFLNLDVGYYGEVLALDVIQSPENAEFRFVENLTIEIIPRDYYNGTDVLKFKIKDENENWSDVITVNFTYTTETFTVDDIYVTIQNDRTVVDLNINYEDIRDVRFISSSDGLEVSQSDRTKFDLIPLDNTNGQEEFYIKVSNSNGFWSEMITVFVEVNL